MHLVCSLRGNKLEWHPLVIKRELAKVISRVRQLGPIGTTLAGNGGRRPRAPMPRTQALPSNPTSRSPPRQAPAVKAGAEVVAQGLIDSGASCRSTIERSTRTTTTRPPGPQTWLKLGWIPSSPESRPSTPTLPEAKRPGQIATRRFALWSGPRTPEPEK